MRQYGRATRGLGRATVAERLEGRRLLSGAGTVASPAAADTGIRTKIAYVGLTTVTSYVASPYAVLDTEAVTVQVSPTVAGGPSLTGPVTFGLDGLLAGAGYIYYVSDEAVFEADPGTYTLTAHYGGDQNYAPADLSPTVITIPAGAAPNAPMLSVGDDQPPAVVNGGAALVGSFTVGVNVQVDNGAADTIKAHVSAVSEADPTVFIPLQTLSAPITATGPGTSATFTVDAPTAGLAPGTYQLVYDVQTSGSTATIYSASPFTVTAAKTPPAGLPAVTGLVGAEAAAPVVAGARSRGLSAAVAVPAASAGVDTVAVYASETGAIDASSTLLGTVRKRVAVKRGAATATVNVPVQTATAPAGTYVLLARVTGAAAADAAVGPVVAVRPPDVQLRAAIGNATTPFRVGSPLAFTLTLTDVGDVAVSGRATIVVSLLGSPGTPSGTTPVPVRTVVKTLTIRPGKPLALRLTGRVPAAAAAAAADGNGGYLILQAKVTTAAAGTETAIASGFPVEPR